MSDSDLLNEAQQRRILAHARRADELLSDIENILTASESKSAFPKYRPDVSLHQARLIRNHIARFRAHLSRVLAAVGVSHQGPQFGSLHSIRVTLTFVRIAVQEMAPEYLRGYGNLPEEAVGEIRGLCSELEGLLDGLEHNLALGEAADLQARLDRLQRTTRETELLRLLDRIVGENELAEFRSPLLNILEKLESRQFEIAVFGRVSSGKSSLLNHTLRTDVLPVGVNPITAVPTRLVFGWEAHLSVTFVDRQVNQYAINELGQYASEERNPGNQLGVARLVVSLPSPRLQDGLVLVDTPGLGALATSGAAETLAYLPQCDLGILLISSVNPVNDEDLNTISALSQAGIPVMVLLSKADLLSADDRTKALAYTKQEILANLNLSVAVHPVSTISGHEELLDNWFRDQFAPLYSRHRELARESVRRKAGALREAVLAALRSTLGRPATSAAADAARLEEIERTLREAAGGIEDARRFCLSATDDVRSLGSIAIERAAAAAAQSWNGGHLSGSVGAVIVPGAIHQAAEQAAAQISGRLRALAEELDSTVKLAARELGGTVGDSSLEDCLREMPRFEAALPEFAVKPPWFRSLKSLAQSWVTRKLRQRLQESVDSGFANYGRSLETWWRRVLGELQTQFDMRADAYRAQLARLMTRTAISAGEQKRIESEIARLEEFMAPA
ncbi:MAG: dynamin family protein, partial [Acidobacteria bacterium]|nr:dynamin family protein [Acidobacteriota bacterium]